MHPDVQSGRRKEHEVLTEWLSTFEVGGTVDGVVTKAEFLNYYHNVSSSVDTDEYVLSSLSFLFSLCFALN